MSLPADEAFSRLPTRFPPTLPASPPEKPGGVRARGREIFRRQNGVTAEVTEEKRPAAPAEKTTAAIAPREGSPQAAPRVIALRKTKSPPACLYCGREARTKKGRCGQK